MVIILNSVALFGKTCGSIWKKPGWSLEQGDNRFPDEIDEGEKGQAGEADDSLLRGILRNLCFLLCEILLHDDNFFVVWIINCCDAKMGAGRGKNPDMIG
jgi:hypothetical protein